MKKIMCVCLALVAFAAMAVAGQSDAERAKAAYLNWEKNGTATAEEKALIEQFYNDPEWTDRNPMDLQGGPDGFGYSYVDNQSPDAEPYEWTELCGDPGALVGPTGDDSQLTVPIGFSFTFYGVAYTDVNINTNGQLTFGGTSSSFSNVCINTTTTHKISAYWDDLLATAGTPGVCTNGNIYRKLVSPGLFVVEWYKLDPFSGPAGLTSVQARLYSDGTIKIVFHETDFTHSSISATVGIETTGPNGLQYSCNVAGITAGRSIRFFFTPPPALGRCCYGDICAPECRDGIDLADCNALGGTFVAGETCVSRPCPLPLAGDLCCNAIPLVVPGTQSGTTVGYTNNGDGDCGGTGAPDVIYSYTPAVNEIVTFTNCDATGFDSKLHIYEGCGSSAILVDCNDDDFCSFSSLRSTLNCVPLTAGVTYYLYQDGFSSSSGSYVLNTFVQSSSTPTTIDASHGYPQYACENLCGGTTTITITGAIRDPNMPPIISILPGCRAGVAGCDEDCTPSSNAFLGAWTYGPDGVWTSIATGHGCICITFEGYLGVELNSFSCIAGNNNVSLNWATASETSNDHFELSRDGNVVANIATQGNGATGHNYSWIDNAVLNGRTYTYNLVSVDVDGTRHDLATETATPSVNGTLPNDYALAQNFPNPFNPTTEISFNILEAGIVTLKVYNLVGQEVATLVNGSIEAGAHTVAFDAANLTSGIYLYRLEAGSFSAEKKMVLMK